MDNTILTQIGEIISKKNSGIIALPANPSLDATAAATALYLSLNLNNKTVGLASDKNDLKYDLVAVNKIQNELVTTGDNLVISFPYIDGSVEKVDYNIQGESFNLVISPRANAAKIDPKKVKFSYIGGNLDFVITIDAPNLNSLGQIYEENKTQFQGKELINIDRHLTNANYGSVNYLHKAASSISEMVFQLLKTNRLPMNKDIASNLYYGIAAATSNFTSYATNADTFATMAELLRLGATKKIYKKPEAARPTSPPQFSGIINREVAQHNTLESVEKEVTQDESDWLKPKIFNNSNLI